MRCDLLRALGKAVPVESLMLGPEFEVVGVDTAVDPNTEAPVSTLRFANGTRSRPFDLVVGCDGINSRVRASMFGSYASKNSGIRIVFGCTGDGVVAEANEDARPESEHGEIHQWFGDGCYALVYTAGGFGSGAKQHNVAVCIADDADLDENVEWRRSDGSVTAGDTNTTFVARADASTDDAVGNDNENDDARRNARARSAALSALRTYEMPASVTTVAKNCDRFFDVGVRYHDPLDEWSDPLGVLVLAGDACHAMPPFLGQGANQALQDAWVLAEQLAAMRGGGKNTGEEKKPALRRCDPSASPRRRRSCSARASSGSWKPGAGSCPTCATPRSGCWGSWGSRGRSSSRTLRPVLK